MLVSSDRNKGVTQSGEKDTYSGAKKKQTIDTQYQGQANKKKSASGKVSQIYSNLEPYWGKKKGVCCDSVTGV